MNSSSRLRKASKWSSEKHFKEVMALNRKEESLLQQKLEQLHREESWLQREHERKIVKTVHSLNAQKPKIPMPASAGEEAGKAKLSSRRNSVPFMEPRGTPVLQRRRHSIAFPPTLDPLKPAKHETEESNEDVLFKMDNNFKFLSIAFETKPRLSSSPGLTKLPEIKPSSSHSRTSSDGSTDLKGALMRRRHSDVTTLRQGALFKARRSSLANIHEISERKSQKLPLPLKHWSQGPE